MIYSRKDVDKRIEELKIESIKIIEEFKIYFNTTEPRLFLRIVSISILYFLIWSYSI